MGLPREGKILRDLWTLITVTTAPSDEFECVRLTATGIPALIPCAVSASALLHEEGSGWELLLQREGKQLDASAGEPVLPALDELFNRAVRRGDFLAISDPSSLPPALRELGLASLAVVPVRNLRVQFGLVLVGRAEEIAFSAEERFALVTLAEHLAMTLENLRLRTSLERSSKELQRHSDQLERLVEERTAKLRISNDRHRALLEIDTSLRAAPNTSDLLHSIAPAMAGTLPVDQSRIVVRDERQGALVARTLSEHRAPTDSRALERLPEAEGSVFEQCASRGEPVVRRYRDGALQFQFPEDRALYDEGYRAMATLPLLARSRWLGALDVASSRGDDYSASDIEFLSLVASRLATTIDNAQAYQEVKRLRDQLELENEYLREELIETQAFGEMLGTSAAIRHIEEQIEQVAPTDATVLILGESGTGKELVAREIHRRSDRAERPMIRVNCASVPEELYESEFFGHVKGAFTGALKERVGRFAAADGGTLFLDEVGEIPPALQSKLLRVLQEGQYERVGDDRTRSVDVRIVAATNRDLAGEVKAGRFREDLYYRLNVFPVEVPPLRERVEDIPQLAEQFLARASKKLKRRARLTQNDIAELRRYEWPGNVRELQNAIERAVITAKGGRLCLQLPRAERSDQPGPAPARDEHAFEILTDDEIRELERSNLAAALERSGGRIYGAGGAAELLGLKPTTVASRVERLGLKRPSAR